MPSESAISDDTSSFFETADLVGDRIYNCVPLRGHEHISDEEGPWARKTILSFDGGGVRGYSSLLLLKAVMVKIRELEMTHPEDPVPSSRSYPWMSEKHNMPPNLAELTSRVDDFLPCHYFDYMAGTSTGGLSAIMLGRLRMSVDDAIDQYEKFGNAVFGNARKFHERTHLFQQKPKFSSHDAEEAFRKVIVHCLQRDGVGDPGNYVFESGNLQFKSREDRTRSLVYSFLSDKNVSSQHVWRSFDNEAAGGPNPGKSNQWTPLNQGAAATTPIWQVARATTAAPKYFDPVTIGSRKFLDGGIIVNNPSIQALREIHVLHNTIPALFLSIGTGLKARGHHIDSERKEVDSDIKITEEFQRVAATEKSQNKQSFNLKKYLEVSHAFKRTMTDTEGENGFNGWKAECRNIRMSDHEYVRLNVERKLYEVNLDEWRPSHGGTETLTRIVAETQGYLEQPLVQKYINSVAAQAVKIRRQRAATERWESFATDVQYQCNVCKEQKPRPGDRAKLRSHLLAKHDNISLHKDLDRPKREKLWARLRKSHKDKALNGKEPSEKKGWSRRGRHKDANETTGTRLSKDEVEVVLNKSRTRKGVNFNGVQG